METLVEKVEVFGGRLEEMSPPPSAPPSASSPSRRPRGGPRTPPWPSSAPSGAPPRDTPAARRPTRPPRGPTLVSRAGGQPESTPTASARRGPPWRPRWRAAAGAILVTADAGPLLDAASHWLRPGQRASACTAPSGPRLRAGRRMAAFVGRRQELDLLESRLASARWRGRGQLVGIAGEAGIGKSRLLHEFRQRLRGRPCVPRRPLPLLRRRLPYLPLARAPAARLPPRRRATARGDRPQGRGLPRAARPRPRRGRSYLLQFLGVRRTPTSRSTR